MERCWKVHVLAVALLISVCHGVLIVGPKFIRPGRNFTLVASNFELTKDASLSVRLEGHKDGGQSLLNLSELVTVRPKSNSAITFTLPPILTTGSYRVTIAGRNGFEFHRETELVLLGRPLSGLVQMNKPIFKPGDTVQFRVIVLDVDLKPPPGVRTANVTVRDAHGNVIRRWMSGKLQTGVFEGELQIATVPILGKYNISARIDDTKVASKTFEVKEYVLSSFVVDMQPTDIPLAKDRAINLTVFARYYVGAPVKGTATVELYLKEDKLDHRKVLDVYGSAKMRLQFNENLDVYDDSQDVRVRVTFVQDDTNRTVVIERRVTVFRNQYRVQLIQSSPTFQASKAYRCELLIQYQNGKPAGNVAVRVKVQGIGSDQETVLKSDKSGKIKLQLNPVASTQTIDLTVRTKDDDQVLLYEQIEKYESGNAYLKLALQSTVRVGQPLQVTVSCSEKMAFFIYFVVAKGNIVQTGFVPLQKATQHELTIDATEQLGAKSKILVATVVKNVVVFDILDVVYNDLLNDFDLQVNKSEARPGEQLELQVRGRPGAFVALAAYDESLLQYGNNHQLLWQDVEEIVHGFNSFELNEFDLFHSIGLFARTMDHITFDRADDHFGRAGSKSKTAPKKQVSFRTNFVESWLWKTHKIADSGSRTIKETVPDTTTSWHLTGFSIDPVYGLGIIKKPIVFKTVQPFYIVENLPYSIKRGEVAVLQFILFSSFTQQHQASVTLFNVDNQTEIIGQLSKDGSYTKSIKVPSGTGVPVSFLVKARKLGEMIVRVKASIEPATDTIETVIRVLPESLVERKTVSRFFSHNTYHNKTFAITLDIDRKADVGSKKFDFILTPNILTSVVDNLENLLSVPAGCGEQSMIRLVPNILVLDYLASIGSTNNQLIDRATALLQQGFQHQLRFRQPDGSFGLWEKSGGGLFLTAFVGKSLATASKYLYEVEPAMVEKAYDWLAARQHATGRFDEVGPVFHRDMQGGLRQGIALTSYVLIALLEHPKSATTHVKVIEKGIRYVTDALEHIQDSYDLAIATYALMLHGHKDAKERFLEKLIGMSSVQRNGTERFWHRTANGIETTAYALLSFVQAERYIDATAIMRWLVGQRYTTGSFPRTQDTFVGLKALTKLAEKISPARNDYAVQLSFGTGQGQQFRVKPLDIASLRFQSEITDETPRVEMNVDGQGFGLLQVNYEYSLDLRNFSNRFQLELTPELVPESKGAELRLGVCTSFIPDLVDARSNMVLVEVNFPSGYVVEQKPITGATKRNPIQNIERRFGGTSVAVYYDNMGPERNCFTVTAYRRLKVALKRPAYVIVHDYYDPRLNAIQMYQVDDRGVCDVCEPQDCPAACKS